MDPETDLGRRWYALSRAIILFLALCLGTQAFAKDVHEKTTVYLYTYHNKPPFIVDLPKRTGLYYDFAELLTRKSNCFQFITTYLPRKRLDRLLLSNRLDGVVIGAIPAWFKDKDESRFLWLPGFFPDADEFVSLKISPFEYRSKHSLTGKTLAGVAGYYYFGVEPSIQSGELERINTIGEREVLTLIKKGRADMGIVSRSVFKYFKRNAQVDDLYHFSTIQHESFLRRAFTSRENTALFKHVQSLILEVKQDGSWPAMVDRYQ